jgi:hypothetical protein
MRRGFITLFLSLAFFAGAAAPAYAAANLPLLNPDFSIVPTQCQTCPCDYGGILQLVQNLMNAGIAIGIIAFVLVTVWAGISFMTNPTNPEARSQARAMLINVVVGMIIVLASWLVVDFIMKVIYNDGSQYGPWNSILAPEGSGTCIAAHDATQIGGIIGGITNAVVNGTNSGPAAQSLLPGGSGSCNASSVQAAAAAGGYQISASEANVLACLAKPESSCGQATSGAKTSSGKSTSASGPWQILLGSNDKCHSLDLPACGNLNCSQAYSGGKVKSDPASQALAAQCQAEANNLSCSASAAACIVEQSHGKYTAWTGTADGYSHTAQLRCASGG